MPQNKIAIKLLFFAKAREIMRKHEMDAYLPEGEYTTEALKQELMNICWQLEPISKTFVLALNEEYIESSETVYIKGGDYLAIIPPLSGG